MSVRYFGFSFPRPDSFLYTNTHTYPHTHTQEARAILITGCDTGFGFDLALDLASSPETKWKVYAGCLSQTGVDALMKANGEGKGEGGKGTSLIHTYTHHS